VDVYGNMGTGVKIQRISAQEQALCYTSFLEIVGKPVSVVVQDNFRAFCSASKEELTPINHVGRFELAILSLARTWAEEASHAIVAKGVMQCACA